MFNFMRSTPPFLTGSTQYGTYCKKDSDIDIVLLMKENEYYKLSSLASEAPVRDRLKDIELENYTDELYPPLRFGKLNIIPVRDRIEYFKWKKATKKCKYECPQSKKQAKEIFKKILRK